MTETPQLSSEHPPLPAAAPDVIPQRLDDLIVVRLASLKEPDSPKDLARTLRALAPLGYSDADWRARIEEALARLQAAGIVDGRRKAPGAEASLARMGLRPADAWRYIQGRFLPGIGLGIEPHDKATHDRLTKPEHWAAAVVARVHGLWREGRVPSFPDTCDALVWRSFQLTGKPKRSPNQVRAYVLARMLGQPGPSAERLMCYLAARDVGAVRADAIKLREALCRRWLAGADWPTADRPVAPVSPPPPRLATVPNVALVPSLAPSGAAPPVASISSAGDPAAQPAAGRPLALPEFAAIVRQAAARATEGVFGRYKVFIAPLWRALRTHPALGDLSLDAFKRELVAANRAGLLTLARADMAAVLSPREIAESETRHLEAEYHFVEREEAP